jgi:hypothetical protein
MHVVLEFRRVVVTIFDMLDEERGGWDLAQSEVLFSVGSVL